MSSESQREQVLRGVADAIAAKGYSATTISDIAKAARASRTTVYAQFPDKDSALIALHQEFGARVVAAVVEAHRVADGDWRERLTAMVGAYVDAMASASAGERASLLEVASIGPAGRASRQAGQDRFAAVVVEISGELADGFRRAATPVAASSRSASSPRSTNSRCAPTPPTTSARSRPIAVDLLQRLVLDPDA